MDHFSLQLWQAGAFTTVYEQDVQVPYPLPDWTLLRIRHAFDQPITGSRFRAEFRQALSWDNYGPRIDELDAVVPEPATLSLLALGGLAVMSRRKGRK